MSALVFAVTAVIAGATCTEKSDQFGRTCTTYVQTGHYRCDELTSEGYDCHCACPEPAPTPAPTFLVDWNPQESTACLSCLNPRNIFYYHDTREECLQRCENAVPNNGPNEECEALTWFDVPVHRAGFIMNCCTMEAPCLDTKAHPNATVFTPDFKNCLLESESEVVPGLYIRDIVWRNCGSDAEMVFLDPKGEELWSKAVNSSGDWWFSQFKLPTTAVYASNYEIKIRGKDGKERAGNQVKVIAPSCSNGCGNTASDIGCTCNPIGCGPPGGFYAVCCEDMSRYCTSANGTCSIWTYPYALPANMGDKAVNITIQWWGCDPGTLSFLNEDFPMPGFGRLEMAAPDFSGKDSSVPVQLSGANGGILKKQNILLELGKSKAIQGTLTIQKTVHPINITFVGVDNNLFKMNYGGGYHRTYFSKSTTIDAGDLLSSVENALVGTSVQYMMEMDGEPLTLQFENLTLRGKFKTASYSSAGDMFDSGDWFFAGDAVSNTGSVVGTFEARSPQPPPARR